MKIWGNFLVDWVGGGGGWGQIFWPSKATLLPPPTTSMEDPAHNTQIRKFDTILF